MKEFHRQIFILFVKVFTLKAVCDPFRWLVSFERMTGLAKKDVPFLSAFLLGLIIFSVKAHSSNAFGNVSPTDRGRMLLHTRFVYLHTFPSTLTLNIGHPLMPHHSENRSDYDIRSEC